MLLYPVRPLHRRHPEAEAVRRGHDSEVGEHQEQDLRAGEGAGAGAPQPGVAVVWAASRVSAPCSQARSSSRSQRASRGRSARRTASPRRARRPAAPRARTSSASRRCRPSGRPARGPTAARRTDVRHRHGEHEQREGPRPVLDAEPVRQVDDDAREEARLGGAEEEAQPVEVGRRADERHRAGEHPPGDQDARDPGRARDSRSRPGCCPGSRTGNSRGRRSLRRTRTDSGLRATIVPHRERGVADVDAIEISDKVEQQQ